MPRLTSRISAAFVLFAAFGVAGALVWWQVTPLARYQLIDGGWVLDEGELTLQIQSDGWFVVIGLAAALLAGLVAVLMVRESPFAALITAVLGSVFGAAVMLVCGYLLGPGDPQAALQTAAATDRVPVALEVHSWPALLAWPAGALAAAALILLVAYLIEGPTVLPEAGVEPGEFGEYRAADGTPWPHPSSSG